MFVWQSQTNNIMNINTLTAQKIKELRTAAGYSAEAVAKELGLSKGSYSQLENGKVEITLNKIEAIAQVLHVAVVDILPQTTQSNNHQTNSGFGVGGNFQGNHNNNTHNNFFNPTDADLENVIKILQQIREQGRDPQ